jgi:hypothetical protein
MGKPFLKNSLKPDSHYDRNKKATYTLKKKHGGDTLNFLIQA